MGNFEPEDSTVKGGQSSQSIRRQANPAQTVAQPKPSQPPKREINNTREMYVVGLLNQKDRDNFYHGDATKGVKLRIEERIDADTRKGQAGAGLLNSDKDSNLFETWQEKANKQHYKPSDPRYTLIEPGEFSVSKIIRVETVAKKKELIIWSTERMMDYYLYCEKGVTEGIFIKVDGHIIFGNSSENDPNKRGYININDNRMSENHFELELDSDGTWLKITDLGSDNGTWLVILNYLEDMILPEIEYQCPEIGAFKFELGALCFTLEEIMEMHEAPEILSDFCLINLYTLNDIREIKKHDFDTRIIKAMITADRVEKMTEMMARLIKEFEDESVFLKSRIIMKVLSGKYEGMEVEIGYRGMKLGQISNKGKKSLVFNSFDGYDTFEDNIFDILYKNGCYSLKSYGFSKIFKKFNPLEKNKIYPGHRICAGSQIFTLLQHIHFQVGESNSVVFEEFTNISDVTNISVYAIIQQIGAADTCRKLVKKNLVQTLRKQARKHNLDNSQKFYEAMAKTIYASLDELDRQFIQSHPRGGKIGCDLIIIIIVGQKLFSTVLGNLHCYLTKKIDIAELAVPLNYSHPGEEARINRCCNEECIQKARELTQSTRALGMADFKVDFAEKEIRQDSHYNENYFLGRPDIWTYNLQKNDDIIVIGNAAVFEKMKVQRVVSTIKSKLAIGGSPNDLADEFNNTIMTNLDKNEPKPVMICLILNMGLIDV